MFTSQSQPYHILNIEEHRTAELQESEELSINEYTRACRHVLYRELRISKGLSRSVVLNLPKALTLYSTVPHIGLTPNHRVTFNFITVILSLMNPNVTSRYVIICNIGYAGYLICGPCERVI